MSIDWGVLNKLDYESGGRKPGWRLVLTFDAQGRIGKDGVKTEAKSSCGIYRRDGSDFDGSDFYFGDLSAKNLEHLLPGWLASLVTADEGEFHSRHGLFFPTEAGGFYPSWLSDHPPVVHIPLLPSGETRFRWRFVQSLPSRSSQSTVHFFARTLLAQLRQALTVGTLRADFAPGAHSGQLSLPSWSDTLPNYKELKDHQSEDVGLVMALDGVALTLAFDSAPLRLNIDRLRLQKIGDDDFHFSLEEGDPATREPVYTISIDENGAMTPDPLTVPVHPLAPRDGLHDGSDDGTRQSLWVHSGEKDEWLGLPFPALARSPVVSETRYWPVGRLLAGHPASMEMNLWLDNCGPKTLRGSLNLEGRLKSLTLSIERVCVDIGANQGFWWAPGLAERVPDVSRRVGTPSRVTLISSPELALPSTMMLTVTISECRLSGNDGSTPAVHWVRPGAGLLAPPDWASHDPLATVAPSRLRGLIPLEAATWEVIVAGDAAPISPGNAGDARDQITIETRRTVAGFPAFAHGRRLLLGAQKTPCLELEVVAGKEDTRPGFTVRRRHALPHLDALFALTVPDEVTNPAGPATVAFAEELTRIRSGYHGEEDAVANARPLALDILLDESHVTGELEKLWADLGSRIGADRVAVDSSMPRRDQLDGFLDILWYQDWLRWAVRPTALLADALGEDLTLSALDFQVDADTTRKVRSVRFRIVAADRPMAEVFRQAELLLTLADGQARFDGRMPLSADWLATHYDQGQGGAPIRWLERDGADQGPTVSFLGLDSKVVSWQADDRQLTLTGLRYWFCLDGLPIAVDAKEDVLVLAAGRWRWRYDRSDLMTLEAAADAAIVPVGDAAVVPAGDAAVVPADDAAVVPKAGLKGGFRRVHDIGPAVRITEFLLAAGTEPLLSLSYAGQSIRFPVRTAYGDTGIVDGDSIALLRAGVYHLAWAGRSGTNTDMGNVASGLQFGAITRVFLRLERRSDGSLVATGMIGWKCPAIEVDGQRLTSDEARVTLYASHAGRWERLRLSGCWVADDGRIPDGTTRTKQVAMPRVDLNLPFPPSESPPPGSHAIVLAGFQAPQDGEAATVSGFQELVASSKGLTLQGDLRFRLLDREERPTDDQLRRAHFGAMMIQWHDSGTLLKALTGAEVLGDGLWYAMTPMPADINPIDWMLSVNARRIVDSSERGKLMPLVDRRVALTRLVDDRWLLCPVTHLGESSLRDMRDKLWLLSETGEDLVELPGLEEKLGEVGDSAMTAPASPEATALATRRRRAAEQMLSFIRWRTPAVLEYWEGNEKDGSFRWEIVDAPLLNPFSSLAFVDTLEPADDRPRSARPGQIPLATLPEDAGTANGESWKQGGASAGRGLALNAPASRGGGYLWLGREVEFEQGPRSSPDGIDGGHPWLADGSRWPASRRETKPDGEPVAETESVLPLTLWTMAAPRPGERMQFTAESVVVGNGDRLAGEDERLAIGSLGRVSLRASMPAGQVEAAEYFERVRGGHAIRWPVAEASAPEITFDHEQLAVMLGEPGVATLRETLDFPIGVSCRTASAATKHPGKRLVLRFESPRPFHLEVKGVGLLSAKQEPEAGPYRVFLQFPPGAQNHGGWTASIVAGDPAADVEGSISAIVLATPEPAADGATSGADRPKLASEVEGWDEAASKPLRRFPLTGGGQTPPVAVSAFAGLLDRDQRVLAYGSVSARTGITEISEDGQVVELRWQSWGEWMPGEDSLVERVASVLLITADGRVRVLTESPRGRPAGP